MTRHLLTISDLAPHELLEVVGLLRSVSGGAASCACGLTAGPGSDGRTSA